MINTSQTLAEIATDIDVQLKAAFSNCKFSVIATGQAPVNDRITISLLTAPVSPLITQSLYHVDLNQWAIQQGKESDGTVQLLTADGLKFMQRVTEIALAYRQGNGSTRLHSNFIFHLRVGGLKAPFVMA